MGLVAVGLGRDGPQAGERARRKRNRGLGRRLGAKEGERTDARVPSNRERRRGAGELGLGRLAGLRRRERAPGPRWTVRVRVEVGRAEGREALTSAGWAGEGGGPQRGEGSGPRVKNGLGWFGFDFWVSFFLSFSISYFKPN